MLRKAWPLHVLQQTNIDGLGVGSALEYFPVKDLIRGLSREFLEISKKKTLIQELRESPSDVIGTSQAMLELYQRVRRVAAYDVNVWGLLLQSIVVPFQKL